jgi:peptidyl-prolyl cis-trans isomerase C
MLRVRCMWVVTAVVVTLAACPTDPRLFVDDTATAVGTIRITETQLLHALAQQGVPRVQSDEERQAVAEHVLASLTEKALLLHIAERDGLRVAPNVVERELQRRAKQYGSSDFMRTLSAEQRTLPSLRKAVEEQLLQDAVIDRVLQTVPAVTDADVAERYQRDLKRHEKPEQVHVRQLLLRTSEEARHVLDQLQRRRMTFDEAARQYSIGIEKDEGGDLGFFAKGALPAVFEVCHSMPERVVSSIIPSEYGFHIFEVIERRRARVEALEDVADELAEELQRERNSEAVRAQVAAWQREVPAQVIPGALERVLERLPVAEREPSVKVEASNNRALDSHADIDPVPPVPKEWRKAPPDPNAPSSPSPSPPSPAETETP